jgi:hypothetical protein
MTMNTVVFENMKVTELPDARRENLNVSADARVTVRIDDETTPVNTAAANADVLGIVDPAFGIAFRETMRPLPISISMRTCVSCGHRAIGATARATMIDGLVRRV